jgi:predicted transcriptional regulator of viral defense system
VPLREKASISKLARASKAGLITVETAAHALGLSPAAASARLARMARSGWAERVRRGLYLISPLESEPGQKTTSEDPWVLARELFSPCYIGGWSAAEHWGLTEQLFRSTLVVTAAPVRHTNAIFLGNEFRLFAVRPDRLSEGVIQVWRGSERVAVSGPERTLIDCLSAPELCGGVRHLVQLLGEYGESEKKDFSRLVAIARKTASGAAWKRLGYIAEILWPEETTVSDAAKRHLSAGYSRLDPAVRQRGRLLKRWRLWVNVDLHEFGAAASKP